MRFDGGHKRLAFAVEQLAPYVRFEPVCPEMAIGLPTPRPALRLVKQAQPWPAMRYSNDAGVDLTEEMRGFSAQRVAALQHLCGYIVCAKSPSCGLERVRVYSENGKDSRKTASVCLPPNCCARCRGCRWKRMDDCRTRHCGKTSLNGYTRCTS